MPVTVATLRTTPYRVGNLGFHAPTNAALPAAAGAPHPPPTASTRYGSHVIFPTNEARADLAIAAPTPGVDARATLAGPYSATGDTIFLKYFDEEITSIRLPVPPPPGVTLFVTDNLTGCRFYVDQIGANGDLVVHHANTHQHTAGANADCDAELPAATLVLDNLHATAVANYALFGLPLLPRAVCGRPTYFGAGGADERRKHLQGRTQRPLAGAAAGGGGGGGGGGHAPPPPPLGRPKFMGGCTIAGFPIGGTWQFWYQLWGATDYRRPDLHPLRAAATFHWNYLHRRRTEGLDRVVGYADFRVVDCQRIF